MKITLILFALLSGIPNVSAAFDCATDHGMELVAGGSYREAQRVWAKISEDPGPRAASQIMAQWGDLSHFELREDSVSLSASTTDLTDFLEALLRCPSSRQRGANLLLGTAHLSGVGVARDVAVAK